MVRYLTLLARLTPLAVCLTTIVAPAPVAAQTPTSTISGRTTDTTGLAIPGVAVTIESPSLQGTRTATTSENGDYIFKFLPPGPYTVAFQLTGFAPVKESRDVALARPSVVDAVLRPDVVRETVTVTTTQMSVDAAATTNIRHDLLSLLPSTRTVLAAVNLAPAVHATGPNNAVSISGAATFDNLFMLNGVKIQDNIRGTPLDLYIEDALQETTVFTSGISAEYGRFTGGLVNAITKSGSNVTSGSFRTGFTNDNWRSVTPFGEPKLDAVVPTYEFTIGGPIVANRTWFFGAGRLFDQSVARQTAVTEIPYELGKNEKRGEFKLTQSLGRGSNLQVAYTGIEQHTNNGTNSGLVMDLASLTDSSRPQHLTSVHYTAAMGSRLFLEAQYSGRRFAIQHDGAVSNDPVAGTYMLDQDSGASWWSPKFCGYCRDEQRNSDEALVKGSYFLSTGHGAHNIVFGYDTFNDRVRNDNHQSGSDYQVWTTASFADNGVVYPVIVPGFSTFIIQWPVNEASRGTNFRTNALFLNDTWNAGKTLSITAGIRYDRNQGRDAAGHLVARDGAISPRLGLSWDPSATGRTILSASYGRYAAQLANNIASEGSTAGVPSIVAYFYGGDPINADPDSPLVTTDQALGAVFNWLAAEHPDPFQYTAPGVATQIRGSLKSPSVDEFTVGVSREINRRGTIRLDFVNRTFGNFYAERTDTTTGQVEDDLGQVLDLRLVQNTNLLKRQYRALDAQGSYRIGTKLDVGASYTLSRLWGNVNGETADAGPVASDLLSYPEYLDPSWTAPVGDLLADQRHRARVWGNIALPSGTARSTFSLGIVEQLQSGTPYGAVGTVDTSEFVDNPGYVTPPVGTIPYYFTARDAFHTQAMYRTDLSFNYGVNLADAHRTEAFVQFQLLNVFNQFQTFNMASGAINTTVLTSTNNSRFAPFNPFTDAPVQGVNWDYSKRFGTVLDSTAYTLPREFRFSVGLRF